MSIFKQIWNSVVQKQNKEVSDSDKDKNESAQVCASESGSQKERLVELRQELEGMAEPLVNGVETKEYYSHLACTNCARILELSYDIPLTPDKKHELNNSVHEYKEQEEGLEYDYPWERRVEILEEMLSIVLNKS